MRIPVRGGRGGQKEVIRSKADPQGTANALPLKMRRAFLRFPGDDRES